MYRLGEDLDTIEDPLLYVFQYYWDNVGYFLPATFGSFDEKISMGEGPSASLNVDFVLGPNRRPGCQGTGIGAWPERGPAAANHFGSRQGCPDTKSSCTVALSGSTRLCGVGSGPVAYVVHVRIRLVVGVDRVGPAGGGGQVTAVGAQVRGGT